jgi:hypothetical protein
MASREKQNLLSPVLQRYNVAYDNLRSQNVSDIYIRREGKNAYLNKLENPSTSDSLNTSSEHKLQEILSGAA